MGTQATEAFRVYLFSGRPDQVVNAVELGFDIFSGSFPYLLTQKGHAGLYDYKMPIATNNDSDHSDNDDEPASKVPIKKRKISEPSMHENFIDLNDKKYLN